MTRAYLGLVVLDVGYLVSGYALLYGLGIVRSGRHSVRYAGLALFGGWAFVAATLAIAVVLGVNPNVATTLAVVLVTAAGGVALSRFLPRLELAGMPREQERFRRLAAFSGMALLLVGLASALAVAARTGADSNWDAWAFWLAKAKAIYYFHGLDTGVGGFTTYANPDYPPLAPSIAAATFHLMGGAHAALLPLQQCVLGIAFVGAMVALLSPYVPRWVLFPSLAMLVLSPVFWGRFSLVLPDQSVAYFLCAAAIGCILWLEERRPAWLVFSIVFLAAAALTKDEGLFLGGLLVATTLLASVAVHRRAGIAAVALVLGPAAIVVWKLWLPRHGLGDVSRNYQWNSLLDPGYLSERQDRLGYAVGHMLRYVFDPRGWLLVMPLVLGALVLVARALPAQAATLSAWLLIGFAGLAVTYWIGVPEIHWYVQTSAQRVVAALPTVAGTVFPLLLGLALARDQPPPTGGRAPIE